jgi:uncharacterized protein
MSDWQVRVVNEIATLDRAQWDALVGDGSPFLEWDWLASLEEAGCVRADRGWAPHHLVVESGGRLIAACPLYLKGHSEGEFVFDHEWAYAAQNAGLNYYPKLLVAVPFTPATGVRFLTAPGQPRAELVRTLGEVLKHVAAENELSSVHVNFCLPDEVEALRPLGFLERVGMQYHWQNHGYASFEDYLAAFRSKRRTKIRHERKALAEQGVQVRALAGDAIPDALVPTLYRLYKEHIDKLYWGRLYLNPRFFELAAERLRRNLCFVAAERDGRVIAGTFNVQKNGVFYGRYWGAFEEVPFLHFNVCYYAAIEHCIGAGLQRMEPGAGGDFKQLRGFDPSPTRSMHFFTHPGLRDAVAKHLKRERERMGLIIEHLNEQSQLKDEVRQAGS